MAGILGGESRALKAGEAVERGGPRPGGSGSRRLRQIDEVLTSSPSAGHCSPTGR